MSLMVGTLQEIPELQWNFEAADQVGHVANLEGAQVREGNLQGLSRWDPYVYLQLPEGGIKAADFRTLQMRLYSSAPADLLDVYYKTAAGYWCLGGALPVKAGWCVYTLDLETNGWRETPWPEARRWGGPDGQIVSLRIDPGNQEDRWIAIDWLRLSGEKSATTVEEEPRLEGAQMTLEAPTSVLAGEVVTATATLHLPPAARGQTITVNARLQTSHTLIAAIQQPVQATGKQQQVLLRLPTLPFLESQAELHAAIMEGINSEGEGAVATAIFRVKTKEAESVDFPLCEVRELGGSPAVFVDGQPIPFCCFVGLDPFTELDASRKPRHVEMAEVGISIFSDWFGTSEAGDLGHVAEGHYDYSGYDLYFARLAQVAPEARFLPHVYVTPPLWWQEAHPEEMVRYDTGEIGLQSFASERWKKEIGEDLIRLIRHFREAPYPYADRIIGLVICSGHTAEWQTWGIWNDKFTDWSEPGVQAWRAWLKQKYGSDDALSRAWANPAVQIATALPPSPERRRSATHFMLRNPKAEAEVIDYLQFLGELDAEAILHFARLSKQASERRLLIGTYYGYLTQHHYHQAESGHCGIERVLDSADIDFLMSPPIYTERAIGEVSAFMSAVDSVHRHGKIWLSEADYRTHLSDPGSGYGRAATVQDSLNILWREFAHVLCKRAGVSWFDMANGWLSGPEIPPELGHMNRLMRGYWRARKSWHAEVAVFIDPISFYYLKPDPKLLLHITLYPMVNLYRAGAPFDVYVLSDLWKADLPEYKLYIFLNPYVLNRQAREAIRRRTAQAGVAALWHWAPGYCWPDAARLATAAEMTELVGIKLREIDEELTLRLSPREGAATYAHRLIGLSDRMNPSLTLGPLFVPAEGDVVLRLEPGGLPGLAKKEVRGATTFFSTLPHLPPSILRQVYLDAGVHVYVDTDDCIYADGDWFAIHSGQPGPRLVNFPTEVTLRSMRSGHSWKGRTVRLNMPEHYTELLRIEG
ncbi:MAG: hypothetical protein ACUVX8_15160 [Candidatus Zipacnadales bacterium]